MVHWVLQCPSGRPGLLVPLKNLEKFKDNFLCILNKLEDNRHHFNYIPDIVGSKVLLPKSVLSDNTYQVFINTTADLLDIISSSVGDWVTSISKQSL